MRGLTKRLAKLVSNSCSLRQTIGIGHPGIEASIKVNDWARVGAARMPGHQCMTLQAYAQIQ